MKDKENISHYQDSAQHESVPDPKKLWFRILLVYGSNQHYVKPIKVCQQHRKETNSDKDHGITSPKRVKQTEPMNLTKPFPNKILVSNKHDIT